MSNLQISPRKHGLQLPFNKYQTISWGLFGAELAATILVYIPPLDPVLRVVGGTIMLFLLCATFFCAFKSSFADPTDPTVYEERQHRDRGEDFVTDLKHYCSICDTHVLARTKHCGQCNRCVNIFDHHCQWLNNCVGARNYGYFAKTVVLLFLNASAKLAFGGYVINRFYTNNEDYTEQSQQFYDAESSLGFLNYFVIISCVLNVVFWLMMLQLIILHLYLHSQNLTTYEYIVKKRERRALAKAQKEGGHVPPARKSRVIKKMQEDDQTGRSQPRTGGDDLTATRLVGRSKPSVSYDHSHFYASHDTTKDHHHQEYLKNRTQDRPETAEPFGTCVTSVATHHGTLMNAERKLKPLTQTPAAVLHETSMSNDFSVNDTSSVHNNKNVTGLYEKETKDIPDTATKSPKSFSIIKEKCEEDIATMRDQYAPRIQEEIRHLSFPEVMDCDLTVDKSQETSKIMKFMETISDNVVMRNPLSKLMFGIDMNKQQSHLVTSPKDIMKTGLPKLDFYKNLRTFKPIESPHELGLLKSDVYYINSPNARFEPMFSPSTLLPNSCRIQRDKKSEHGGTYGYATERPTYFDSGLIPQEADGVAEDKPISKAGLAQSKKEEGALKNPFFQTHQDA